MDYTNFIVMLVIILVLINIFNYTFKENFISDIKTYELVNYNTRNQNCNELTYAPKKCIVETVIPKNKIVCNESLTPITNNDISCNKKKYKKNPTVNLTYDFDLLSSFNNSQLNNAQINNNDEINNQQIENFDELNTDIRSFNSLENDLISNY
jgi:hypothetical protein